ncbi:MAG: hypothetical protein V1872_11805 [bacterium]
MSNSKDQKNGNSQPLLIKKKGYTPTSAPKKPVPPKNGASGTAIKSSNK